MKNTVELLAPAGSQDAAHAAFDFGADAIYLGLPRFSARAEAINFTQDEFLDVVGYGHHLNKKVYVTLNTLIKDKELKDAIEMLQLISISQADAVIVQDLGILQLIHEHFPQIRVHASTQMAIHNLAGAEYLKNLGIKRVTLARELSLTELSEIADCDIETESFLHGALCYSYSGLCMFSSMQTGRSANRGRCAYSCRELFSCPELGLNGHAFSLRDLSLTTHIQELLDSGVDSLKIEGRKKSALYVAAVVRLYRSLIDNTASENLTEQHLHDLKTIFSRESTHFFAAGAADSCGRAESIDTKAVGHRGAPIGSVETISRHGKEQRLVFTPTKDFEKHDGLQIDIPDSERPYGFAVNELYTVTEDGKHKPVFCIAGSETAAVSLPADHPELPLGAPVYLASSQRVKRELKWHTPKPGEYRKRYPVDIKIDIAEKSIELTAAVHDETAAETLTTGILFTAEDTLSPARNPEQSFGAAKKIFSKTGETPFILDQLTLLNRTDLFIPASLLNQLRRELYEKLIIILEDSRKEKLQQIQHSVTLTEATENKSEAAGNWIIKSDSPLSLLHVDPEYSQKIHEVILAINENTNYQLLTTEINKIQHLFTHATIRIALPAICRNSRLQNMHKIIQHLTSSGISHWQTANLWGLQILKAYAIKDITAAATIYTLNHASHKMQQELGLKWSTLCIEDELANIKQLLSRKSGQLCLTVFQDTPLFIGEACSYSSFNNGCNEDCCEINQHREWRDNRGNSYILSKKGCRSYLINKQSFSLSGYLQNFTNCQPDYYEIDFINRSYTSAEINRILQSVFINAKIDNTHTGNLLRILQ